MSGNQFIERLEDRQLLSGAMVNAHGVLRVVGTPKNDVIDVTVNADETVTVSINGSSPTVTPFSGVKAIKVFGRRGDDQITVNESAALTLIPATVSGGRGNDTITVGNENNFVSGGHGNDLITAGNGNNVIQGDRGNDSITVGNGSNIVLGGPGSNTIVGGTGNDTLVGGNGADSISGGGGDDLLWGLHGNDTLVGNIGGLSGSDVIYTGTGTTNVVEPGPDDIVNPGGKVHPPSADEYLKYLYSLRQVPA